jgi:hypothetical protein
VWAGEGGRKIVIVLDALVWYEHFKCGRVTESEETTLPPAPPNKKKKNGRRRFNRKENSIGKHLLALSCPFRVQTL